MINGGSPADLLINQAVLNPKVHGHTSRAPPVGIEPTTPQSQAIYGETFSPQTPTNQVADQDWVQVEHRLKYFEISAC